MPKIPYKLIIIAVLAIIALVFVFDSYVVVPPGYRGVKIVMGRAEPLPLEDGFHLISPIGTNVVKMGIQSIRYDDKTNTYTKDVQDSDVTYAVTYNLDPQAVSRVYSNVGVDYANILLAPAVSSTLKAIIGNWDAVDLVSHRDQVAAKILAELQETLKTSGIHVTQFNLINVDYTKAFQKSVEDKVIAQQRAIEEENRTAQVQQQANQKIIASKAEAESMTIRAKALESNPKLVNWEAVQKWDGHLPVNMYAGNGIPFISVDTKAAQEQQAEK
jgi:prohibitin 2